MTHFMLNNKLKILLYVTILLTLLHLLIYNRFYFSGHLLRFPAFKEKLNNSMLKNKSSSGVSGQFERFRPSRLAENSKSQKDSRTHISFVGEMYSWITGLSERLNEYQLTKGLKETILNERHIKCKETNLDLIEDKFHVSEVKCSKIFSGDHKELEYAKNFTKTIYRELLSEQFYLNLTTNCELFQRQRGYITCPLTSEEEDFPIAFSMIVYKDIEMVERLLRSIYRPQNYYCIHVDRKSYENFMNAVSAIANCFENVFLIPREISVHWAQFSVLEPELMCMQQLWRYGKWKYFINLTGQDFPLKTNRELVQILTAYKGANDVDGTIKRADSWRWGSIPPPHNLTILKGSVHIAVNRHFVDYILHGPKAKDLLDWVNKTVVPDETFFTMLNHNPQLGIKGTYKGIPETEPDNSTVKPFLARYKNWRIPSFQYPCAGRTVRDICILTTAISLDITMKPEQNIPIETTTITRYKIKLDINWDEIAEPGVREFPLTIDCGDCPDVDEAVYVIHLHTSYVHWIRPGISE